MNPDSLVLRRWAHFGAARAPLWFARLAPGPIAVLLSPFVPRARRAVVEQQRLVLGRRGPLTEYIGATRTLVQYACCLTEALGASRPSAPTPEVEIRGEGELSRVLSTELGIVVATAHVGPWEGAASALAGANERSVLLVMEEERDPAAAHFEDELRRARGLGVVRLGQHPLAALPILEHLRQGGIAAVQIDRPTRAGAFMHVPLFGAPFRMPEGPFRLAELAKVPILPVFAARLGFMRRLVVVGKPVWPGRIPGRPRRERILDLATQVAQQLEGHLREFPTQWFHFTPNQDGPVDQRPPRAPGPGESQANSPTKVA